MELDVKLHNEGLLDWANSKIHKNKLLFVSKYSVDIPSFVGTKPDYENGETSPIAGKLHNNCLYMVEDHYDDGIYGHLRIEKEANGDINKFTKLVKDAVDVCMKRLKIIEKDIDNAKPGNKEIVLIDKFDNITSQSDMKKAIEDLRKKYTNGMLTKGRNTPEFREDGDIYEHALADILGDDKLVEEYIDKYTKMIDPLYNYRVKVQNKLWDKIYKNGRIINYPDYENLNKSKVKGETMEPSLNINSEGIFDFFRRKDPEDEMEFDFVINSYNPNDDEGDKIGAWEHMLMVDDHKEGVYGQLMGYLDWYMEGMWSNPDKNTKDITPAEFKEKLARIKDEYEESMYHLSNIRKSMSSKSLKCEPYRVPISKVQKSLEPLDPKWYMEGGGGDNGIGYYHSQKNELSKDGIKMLDTLISYANKYTNEYNKLAADLLKKGKLIKSGDVKQEDADVQSPTTIDVTLPEKMDGVKKHLELYAYLIKYLQQYKKDPHLTVGKLLEDELIPNKEDFQDVKDALVGAFTSEKATILGCQKLVNLIEVTAEAIRKDYVYLSNSTINSSVHDVISNINSIIETTDPGMLEKRKLMYRQNNVTLKYGNYKLEKAIQPYLQELSSSMTMLDYLKKIRELQHSLKLDTLKDLEESIRKYKYNNVFIANNNAYIGKSQFMNNIIEANTTPPGEVSALEAMKAFILKVDISQDQDTVSIDILDNIIDNFGNTLSGLKRSVEDFNKLLNSIEDASSKLTDTLDILTNNYVKPYADNTLLKDEFITGYQQCMQAMNNCLTNDKNIILDILHSAYKLNILLNNYSYVYSLLEKLTIEMTITEKSSISE